LSTTAELSTASKAKGNIREEDDRRYLRRFHVIVDDVKTRHIPFLGKFRTLQDKSIPICHLARSKAQGRIDAEKDYSAIVRLLLEQGADISAQGEEYSNALRVALSKGHEAIVQRLLEKGADVNAQGEEYGNARAFRQRHLKGMI
jgi:hypothetical protein